MFLNEHRNHWYSTGSYFWCKNLFEFLRFAVINYMIIFISYYASSQPDVNYWYQGFWEIPDRFLQFVSYFFLGIFNFQGFVIIINAVYLKSANLFQSSMIISFSISVLMILGMGFFIPVYSMPYFVQILNYPNYKRIYFESILLILYKERCELTSIVFNSYEINESHLTFNLYILIIEGVVLRIIGLIVVLFESNSYQKQSLIKKNLNNLND